MSNQEQAMSFVIEDPSQTIGELEERVVELESFIRSMVPEHCDDECGTNCVCKQASRILSASAALSCKDLIDKDFPAADTKRVQACVNACREIPTEALKAGVIGKMLKAFQLRLKLSDMKISSEERNKITNEGYQLIREVSELMWGIGR